MRHGNEDTMREMLRIKRSVQATYNTQVNMMAAQFLNQTSASSAAADVGGDAMRLLDAKAAAEQQARQQQTLKPQTNGNIMFVRGETQGGNAKDKVVNPDEIDIGDSDEEEEDDDDAEAGDGATNGGNEENVIAAKRLRIEQQAIPAKVFGSLKKATDEDEQDVD